MKKKTETYFVGLICVIFFYTNYSIFRRLLKLQKNNRFFVYFLTFRPFS